LCMSSDLDWYLSAGFTMGAFNSPMGALGAFRGLVVPLGIGTALLGLVVAKHRDRAWLRAWTTGLAGRRAVVRALFLQSLLAIIDRNRLGGQLIQGTTSVALMLARLKSFKLMMALGKTGPLSLGKRGGTRRASREHVLPGSFVFSLSRTVLSDWHHQLKVDTCTEHKYPLTNRVGTSVPRTRS
jgi:hypothetical protein